MKVKIRTLEGRSFGVDIGREETVWQLKAKISEAESIRPDNQRLIFSARELQVLTAPVVYLRGRA